MIKNSFFFIAVLFIAQVTYSQQISLRWAEKIPTRGNISILGGKNGKFYTTHRGKENELIGRIYDKNMNMVEEKNINFNLAEKKYFYQGAYFVDGKIMHFIRDNIRKRGAASIYVGFSDSKLNTSPKILVFDETDENKKTLNFGLRSISPDSTKVLSYHEIKGKKREPNKLVYRVYNSSISKVINKGIVSIPIKSRNYATSLVEVDNFGNVYLLAKINKERKERKKGMSKYYFKLIVFAKNEKIKEFDFDYPDNNISFFDVIPSKDNKFFCTGFLNNLKGGKKREMSDEMFFAKLDCKTISLEDSKKIEIDGLYPKRARSKDLMPYKIRDIYQKKDGGLSIVAEQFQLIVVTDRYGNSRYIYYYGDIACIQTDKKTNVLSVTKVPKYQKNAKNPSIISAFKNDNTYIVYEDVESNITATTDKDTKKSTGSIFKSRNKNALFVLTVDKNGKPKKDIIYSYKDSKIKPYILGSMSLKNGKILLSGKDQLGLIEIK